MSRQRPSASPIRLSQQLLGKGHQFLLTRVEEHPRPLATDAQPVTGGNAGVYVDEQGVSYISPGYPVPRLIPPGYRLPQFRIHFFRQLQEITGPRANGVTGSNCLSTVNSTAR
ncbi:MAG: hypothetical protein WBO48_14760 [Candidatus Promineifilaceae bacterium]